MQQPWIGKPINDILFILLPPFASLLFIFLFPSLFQNNTELGNAGWLILILLVDVAHVYSTLYRTYFDPQSFKNNRSLLVTIPFIGFVAAVLIYSMSSEWFWRILAYTAVFHFIRQQYGFLRVYSRSENHNKVFKWIDVLTIYTATIYPILYWHLEGPKNFNWFVDNDFMYLKTPSLLPILTAIYLVIIVSYLLKEVYLLITTKTINLPKTGIVTGTLLSWYFGIIYFNGDLAFTLLNVISHGVPYMGLIWIYGKKHYSKTGSPFLKKVFSRYGIFLFLAIIFLLAFIEEGLWDFSVWKEHGKIFGTGSWSFPEIPNTALSFIVPLLALPQITHYILDGFIWKIREGDFKWKKETVSVP